jgi:hypothetical protein
MQPDNPLKTLIRNLYTTKAIENKHELKRMFPSHGRGHRFNPCRAHHESPAKPALSKQSAPLSPSLQA